MKKRKSNENANTDKIPHLNLQVKQKKKKKNYSFFINDNLLNQPLGIKNNIIDQSKYNILTFLPKALLFQFYRLANDYFLIIAIIQCIGVISPLGPSTAIAPLFFVISVSLIREGIEDYDRHKYDNQLNSEPVTVFKENKWLKSSSGDLLVGELVIVLKDYPFPADLILLDSNLPEGACFIETGTLDGEKTLKNRLANKLTSGIVKMGNVNLNEIEVPLMEGKIECDSASADLYKFDGTIEIKIHLKKPIKDKISLDAKQILLKGIFLII